MGPVHLCFLVTDPDCNPNQKVVIANFTSLKTSTVDRSCVVQAGEHPMINRTSVVNYRKADIAPIGELVSRDSQGEIARRTQLTTALYDKVVQGFAVSDQVRIRVKEMLKEQDLI